LLLKHYLEKYVEWMRRDVSYRKRVAAIMVGGFIFLLLIPYILLTFGMWLDRILGLPPVEEVFTLQLVGFIIAVSGWLYALWAIYVQLRIGKGTPLPMLPTKKLVVSGPYRYSRNPMAFGSILLYFGISLIFHSISMCLLILILLIPLLLYLRFVEEKELELRFGEEYIKYRQVTSFIIPLPPKSKEIN